MSAKTRGVNLLVEAVLAQQIPDFFYLIGGPMTETMERCIAGGMRGIDVRDERAATFAAIAYSRVAQRTGIVMACSGPGTINTVPGVSHAFADGSPVVVIGGSSTTYQREMGGFQATDQVGVMRPITKWAHQVPDPDGVHEAVAMAFKVARSGAPGPVYLDMPADVLYGESPLEVDQIKRVALQPESRSAGDRSLISAAVDLLERAMKPIVIAGSGVLWSEAWEELREFVELSGVPFYTTPIARGLLPENHPLSFPAARSTAFREADCIFVIGTRDNYILNYLQGPVVSENSSLVQLNINPRDLSRNRVADVPILADAKLGLRQLSDELATRGEKRSFDEWVIQLAGIHMAAIARRDEAVSDEVPIHPLRLCLELDRALPRDAVCVVDGHETLGFSRRAISAYAPGRMLTPGPYGTMGIGVPFGIGAKVAVPGAPVVVLTGDGAFGYHAVEIDTAVRHSLGIVYVIANNGGWASGRNRPGRALGFTDYQRLADVFGCWGTKVTEPSEIGQAVTEALGYADRERKPALVNVIIADVSNGGRAFSRYTRHGSRHYDAV